MNSDFMIINDLIKAIFMMHKFAYLFTFFVLNFTRFSFLLIYECLPSHSGANCSFHYTDLSANQNLKLWLKLCL